MKSLRHFITRQRLKKAFLFSLPTILMLVLIAAGAFYSFLFSSSEKVNFLILGVGGEEHTAGDLTDTIFFVSLDGQDERGLVLFLPRDIWLPALRTKLNSVYHYRGLKGSKKSVEEILAQPIDYSVMINFSLFTQIVDLLGGVEIEVERTFDDYRYPIPGKEDDLCDGDPEYQCRYEHLHFDAGPQKMNGERALKFVRSRFAEGEEGSDFARSERQQKVVLAIKDRIFSPSFFLNPQKALQLIEVVNNNLETDIPQEKYFDLLRLGLKLRNKKITTKVLNEGYLITPPSSQKRYDNQWVLVPQAGDWSEIQEYVEGLLSD